MMGIQPQLLQILCFINLGWPSVLSHNQIADKFQYLFDSMGKNDGQRNEIFHKDLKQEALKERQVFDTMRGELQIAQYSNKRRNIFEKSNSNKNVLARKRETEKKNPNFGKWGGYSAEDPIPGRGEIFKFNMQNQNFFTTPSSDPDPPRRTVLDPEIQYCHAIWDGIQLFNAQDIQINNTRVHLINVWGAEDEGVKQMLAKLSSMETFVDQKLKMLQNRLEGPTSPSERIIKPFDWITMHTLTKDWQEIERFIDRKCAEKTLTRTQEDELYAMREWLKFSDQELAIPYDTMKERIENIQSIQSA